MIRKFHDFHDFILCQVDTKHLKSDKDDNVLHAITIRPLKFHINGFLITFFLNAKALQKFIRKS